MIGNFEIVAYILKNIWRFPKLLLMKMVELEALSRSIRGQTAMVHSFFEKSNEPAEQILLNSHSSWHFFSDDVETVTNTAPSLFLNVYPVSFSKAARENKLFHSSYTKCKLSF